MKPKSILIQGNPNRNEFISLYRNILSLAEKFGDDYSNCSVFFQSYPGEFSQMEVNQLIADDPLAPILFFLGTACEGENRTGYPLSGCFRLYTYQWNIFYQHQLSLHFSGHPSIFSLPRTTENDELTLFQSANEISVPPNRECLVVCRQGLLGNDSAMNRLLVDFYRRKGYQTRFFDEKTPKSFDGTILADTDDSPFLKILESLQRLRSDFTDAKITVCINSPRINEKIDLQQIGVDEILSKPMFCQQCLVNDGAEQYPKSGGLSD